MYFSPESEQMNSENQPNLFVPFKSVTSDPPGPHGHSRRRNRSKSCLAEHNNRADLLCTLTQETDRQTDRWRTDRQAWNVKESRRTEQPQMMKLTVRMNHTLRSAAAAAAAAQGNRISGASQIRGHTYSGRAMEGIGGQGRAGQGRA